MSKTQTLADLSKSVHTASVSNIRSDLNRVLNSAFSMKIPVRVQSHGTSEWIDILQPSTMLIPMGTTFESADFDAVAYVERQSGLEMRDLRLMVSTDNMFANAVPAKLQSSGLDAATFIKVDHTVSQVRKNHAMVHNSDLFSLLLTEAKSKRLLAKVSIADRDAIGVYHDVQFSVNEIELTFEDIAGRSVGVITIPAYNELEAKFDGTRRVHLSQVRSIDAGAKTIFQHPVLF